jgi:hypothetical protein
VKCDRAPNAPNGTSFRRPCHRQTPIHRNLRTLPAARPPRRAFALGSVSLVEQIQPAACDKMLNGPTLRKRYSRNIVVAIDTKKMRGRKMLRAAFIAFGLFLLPTSVQADIYYQQKWFDYPEYGTPPRITNDCAKKACTNVPVTHGWHIRMENRCTCINPIVKTDLLRRDVVVTVSGPSSPNEAVRRAAVGYAAGCVATAAASSTVGPQVVVSPGGFFAAFKACIAAVSVSGIVGGILNQFQISINADSTHWAPI